MRLRQGPGVENLIDRDGSVAQFVGENGRLPGETIV